MTNTEYEKASITAANPEALLAHADEVIASIEAALATAQEARREIINRYGLNKSCEHKNVVMMFGLYLGKDHPGNKPGHDFCTDCGAKLPL